MTFDEWFTAHYVKRGFVSSRDELKEAWEAATEACTRACEAERITHPEPIDPQACAIHNAAVEGCVAAIRARGQEAG